MTPSRLAIAAAALSIAQLAGAADDHKGHDHNDKKGAEHAHDAKAMHGGIVTVVKDTNYELVPKNDSIMLYVTDHGKPVDLNGVSATLTLLSALEKTEVKLAPAGDKLQAQGAFKVQPGTKAVAMVKFANKPSQSVRFTLK